MRTFQDKKYWIAPIETNLGMELSVLVRTLIEGSKIFALGPNSRGRNRIQVGDMICFYASKVGVVAHATIESPPLRRNHSAISDPVTFPYVLELSHTEIYLDDPRPLDDARRSMMKMFSRTIPYKRWSWLVQGVNQISEEDFHILTTTDKAT